MNVKLILTTKQKFEIMSVKDLMDQLRLAKNKDAKVLFRLGNQTLDLEVMAEVVSEKGNVRFPTLGEVTNAVAIKLVDNNESTDREADA